MPRSAAFAASLAGAILVCAGPARASGAWLAQGSLTTLEQRVAVAATPQRTTLWTSLRFDAAGGVVAVLVPAPAGSALDISSDAWFEALEVATAPRIFPPTNVSPFCPGKSGPPTLFQIDGETGHIQSLAPQNVAVLPDVNAVMAWAAQENLPIAPELADALNGLSGVQFVAVQLSAPPGSSVTPTLRVAMPGTAAMLPLALTRAVGANLRVTAWLIGQGEADLVGGNQAAIPLKSLAWDAAKGVSNYDALRAGALAPGPDTFLVESANHEALMSNVAIAGGTAFIDGVVTTFFERAAAYGDGEFDSAACIAAATPLLSSSETVAASCPPGVLGFIDPAPSCTESPGPGEVDPNILRCGPGADDLAIALSGLPPASVWVTRQTLDIPDGAFGMDALLGFGSGAPSSPVISAVTVDYGGCADAGASSTSSATSSSGTLAGSGPGSSSSGALSTGSGQPGGGGIDFGGVDLDVDVPSDATCSCGDTTATSGDSDSTDTTPTDDSCSSSDPSSSGCSGSSSSSDGTGDSSGCSSGSDSSSSGCSGGDSGSSGCSGGDSGGAGCSGGGGGDFNCTVASRHRLRAPKLSILLMAALSVIMPLRRRGRRSRRRSRAAG